MVRRSVLGSQRLSDVSGSGLSTYSSWRSRRATIFGALVAIGAFITLLWAPGDSSPSGSLIETGASAAIRTVQETPQENAQQPVTPSLGDAEPSSAITVPAAALESPTTSTDEPLANPANSSVATEASVPPTPSNAIGLRPLIVLGVGIITVLGLIIVFKMNAFLALIIAAMIVSMLAPGSVDSKISRVATSFGSAAGNIAIVIGLAAIIGKCMLDSGSADRIVRAFLGMFGAKRSSWALLISGYVLAIPVFFDTVFYLLVPLARSLHKRTGREYLKYVLAIAGGGAITHTLVPPTPGPLLMASILNVDLGVMILVGIAVSAPAAVASLMFASILDRRMSIPMRAVGNETELPPPPDDRMPGLFESILPVALPVVLIALSTIAVSLADREDAAALRVEQVQDWSEWSRLLVAGEASESDNPAKWLLDQPTLSSATRDWLLAGAGADQESIRGAIDDLNATLRNKEAYRESAFLGVVLPGYAKGKVAADNSRMKPVDATRMNRQLLEAAFPEVIAPHEWQTTARRFADYSLLIGNANLALLVSTLIAMLTLVRVRRMSLSELGLSVENALMSGGVIILITAAGSAFGDMLQAAQIGPAIKEQFGAIDGATTGIAALLLGFAIASVLKVAQGSSTVAMIVGAGMMVAIIGSEPLGFHPVYLATAIGSGSLVGSWMNDSGFWIFAKMSGLTEGEALRTWTPLLLVLAFTGLSMSIVLSLLLPLV